MKTECDPEIITAACEGDTDALEQILLQYHPAITQFARKFCATPEDVEDAVQETLWIAAQKIGTLRVAKAYVSWLFRVVQHQCYRLLRYKQHEEGLDTLIGLDYADESPEYSALLKHDVAAALAQLPSPYRQVLIMRDIQGLTAPEVSAHLNLSIETVKSRLHRARKSMRASLETWDE